MEKHENLDYEAPAPAQAAATDDGIPLLGAMQQLNEHNDHGRLQQVQAQAAADEEGGGGVGAALQHLVDFRDRSLQAAGFFLVWGCCVLINTNPVANPEHKFVGFVFLTIGAWLALLTFAGAGAGRAAARAERFLRGLFF